jgi:hypothetical protein
MTTAASVVVDCAEKLDVLVDSFSGLLRGVQLVVENVEVLEELENDG